jgi:hypothetical protein
VGDAVRDAGAERTALGGLFDHAALFPPACLDVPDALAEDRRLRAGTEAWLVRRFVCPLTRLAELGDAPVPLSVVLDGDPDERLEDPRVEAVEVPPGRSPDGLPPALEVYVERDLEALGWLESVAAAGKSAKVRCGGASIPSVGRLAAFVRRCRELGVLFKATAGLHHPVRGEREHGFLNLLAAAAFPGDEEGALAERNAGEFRLGAGGFSWRDRVAGATELERVRRELFSAVGSCSIREPVDDLRALGMLAS